MSSIHKFIITGKVEYSIIQYERESIRYEIQAENEAEAEHLAWERIGDEFGEYDDWDVVEDIEVVDSGEVPEAVLEWRFMKESGAPVLPGYEDVANP